MIFPASRRDFEESEALLRYFGMRGMVETDADLNDIPAELSAATDETASA